MKRKLCALILLLTMLVLAVPSANVSAGAKKPDSPRIEQAYPTGSGMRISWSKVEGVDGYQIKFAEDASFAGAKTRLTAADSHTKRTLSGLEKDKDYFVRVRSFVRKANGKRRFSAWSNVIRLCTLKSSYEFASFSKINSGRAVLYYADRVCEGGVLDTDADVKTVCVNAGHGTKGGGSVRTYCHPDKTKKVTGGSTAAGEITAAAVSSGTTFLDGTTEGVVNLKVALLVKKKLLERGYSVLMIRDTDDIQLDNVARTTLANNLADCHVAIHYNSTDYDAGAFYIGVPDISSYRKMYPVSEHYEEHNKLGKSLLAGLKGRNVKIRGEGNIPLDLTQTSYSTVPSMDIEVGDRASDYSFASVDKIAEGLCDGLDKFFGTGLTS